MATTAEPAITAAMEIETRRIHDGDDDGDDDSTSHLKDDAPPLIAAAAATPTTVKTTTTTTTTTAPSNAVVFSPELLHQYYSRLFPFDFLYSWLSYNGNNNNNATLFSRREFSMTIEPAPGEEIYIRYQSFLNKKELQDGILKRRPVKIDIGAVFSHAPKDHNSIQKSSFQPVERELVFDIDLTDYDDIRQCGCSGANICKTCWGFMKMAVKVMDQGLREDFGFEHVAWFYSGRRGVHAWVCDACARELTDVGRSSVASYFEVRYCIYKRCDCPLLTPL
jgi:DNA primase small subunit